MGLDQAVLKGFESGASGEVSNVVGLNDASSF